MSEYKLKSEPNPSLVVKRDNKPKWYLPVSRREGNRNLHKINRYGLLYRSDLVLKLNKKLNKKIENISSLKKKVNLNKKVIGIGETGLDFYYNHSEKNDQINCFEEHIYAAQEKNLPIIVHTRSAEKETFKILEKHLKKKHFKILIHCFTGSREFAFKLIDLGAYISASGVVTFKKSLDLANTFRDLPNNKILVETDAPYLSPVPLRGKPNEPSYIIHTVKFLSDLKKISFEEFSDTTSNNFFNLFGKLN